MFRRLGVLLCMAMLLTSCQRMHREHHSVPVFPPPKKEQRRLKLPAFHRVDIKGSFDVNLHTGYKHPEVILHGDPRDLLAVTASVSDGLLSITMQKGYPKLGKVLVDVKGQYLNSFHYEGSGTIKGKHLHTRLLDIFIKNKGFTQLGGYLGLHRLTLDGEGYVEIKGIHSTALQMKISGKPKVKLIGMANLESLDLNDDASLSLYWIKSPTLVIRAHGKTWVQLAGLVKRLDVELWGSSRFQGRYLRADRAFVKTHGKSVAEIATVKRQHTLALDSSDILFYNIPTMKTDFMGFAGAVLDMRDLRPPQVQEYDVYNK